MDEHDQDHGSDLANLPPEKRRGFPCAPGEPAGDRREAGQDG